MQNKTSFFVSLFAAITVSACGTSAWVKTARSQSDVGDCATAHKTVEQSNASLSDRAMYHAAIYHDCNHDKPRAIASATLCARHGAEECQNMLVKLGAPIPTADLRAPANDSPLLDAMLLDAMRPSRSMSCINSGGMISCDEF